MREKVLLFMQLTASSTRSIRSSKPSPVSFVLDSSRISARSYRRMQPRRLRS